MTERSWMLTEIAQDQDTHAMPKSSGHTYCGHAGTFPLGGDVDPTCPGCLAWVENLRKQEAP